MNSYPTPSESELARSTQLTSLVKQNIDDKGGVISFSDYMNLALYMSELGYYNSSAIGLGLFDDFTTVPEISPLFSQVFCQTNYVNFKGD